MFFFHIFNHYAFNSTFPYVKLLGEMMESTQSIITLHEVQFSIFMILLEYLYTDEVEVPIDVAMEV